MQPGHPWETKHLDEMRASQRRYLRAMPARLLADLNTATPVIRYDADRGLVEAEVRRRAQRWADHEAARSTLEDLEAALPATALAEMVRVTDLNEPILAADLNGLAQERVGDTGIITDASAQAALQVFAAWALLADRIAGDYEDPRVSAQRADK